MFRRMSIGVLGLAIAVLPAIARQNAAPASADAGEQNLPKAATADPNYVIGPQDVLDVSVWKEPEITRAVPVRPVLPC